MQVRGLHHLNVRTTPEKLEETREFYEYYMGLKVGPRPQFRFGGYWMYVEDHPLVHISTSEPQGVEPAENTDYGFGHIAFDCKGLQILKEKLEDQVLPWLLLITMYQQLIGYKVLMIMNLKFRSRRLKKIVKNLASNYLT